MGLYGELTGIFGAVQEKRAAQEASRILNEARTLAMQESGKLSTQFDPFVAGASSNLSSAAGLLQKYLTQAEGVQVDQGLTAADRIAYQDAAKLLNEQMVGTGNLRSGAAAFGQSELLRRVVADAETRRFNQEMTKLQTLFGGTQQLTGVGQVQGQLGLGGKQLATNLMQTAIGLAQPMASAELQKGASLSNILQSIGSFGDTAIATASGAIMGGMGGFSGVGLGSGGGASGAALGGLMGSGSGGSLTQYMMLQNLFKQPTKQVS